jgi:hypothetical protein
MMRNLCKLSIVLVLLLGAALPSRPHAGAQNVRPLLVVISSATGMTDISTALLRRTFQGHPAEYQSGKRLIPLNLPTGTLERQRFDLAVLGMTPDEIGRFWIDQRVRGMAQPPRTAPTPELAVRVVSSFVGAITYTTAELVKPGVNVLKIDGRRPDERGYLLATP